MKKLIFLFVVALLASCGGGDSAEEIRNKIKKDKDKINDLKKEVTLLEKELKKYEDTTTLKDKIPVKIKKIKYQRFDHYFEAGGVVEPVKEAFISPETNGQIKEIYVEAGDKVKKGKLLAKLNTSITENTIDEVKTSLELATTLFKKQKQLWEKEIGSEIQYLEAKNRKESLESKLETLRSQLEMAIIRSPIDGIVDEVFQKEGELAMPGVQLMQIVNLSTIYINVDVAETYLPTIDKNDIVVLRFPTYPGETIEAPIYRIGNVIEPDNRTFTVQLKIENENEKFKPNMIALIKINDYSSDSSIVVPSLIVKEDLVGKYLYVAQREAKGLVAEKKYVETGKSYNDETVITKGVLPGNSVIVKGHSQVSNGSEIYVN